MLTWCSTIASRSTMLQQRCLYCCIFHTMWSIIVLHFDRILIFTHIQRCQSILGTRGRACVAESVPPASSYSATPRKRGTLQGACYQRCFLCRTHQPGQAQRWAQAQACRGCNWILGEWRAFRRGECKLGEWERSRDIKKERKRKREKEYDQSMPVDGAYLHMSYIFPHLIESEEEQ